MYVCIQVYRRAFIAARTPDVARAARLATRRPCAVPQLLAHRPVLLKIAAAISVAPAPSPCVSRSSRASAIASFWAWAPPSKPRQRGDSQSSIHGEPQQRPRRQRGPHSAWAHRHQPPPAVSHLRMSVSLAVTWPCGRVEDEGPGGVHL